MTLAGERLRELDDPLLTADERAQLRCRVAADFIRQGQYETAREVLGELWPGVGRRPEVTAPGGGGGRRRGGSDERGAGPAGANRRARGGPPLDSGEVYKAYRRADRLLRGTQDAEDVARLRACSRVVMRRLAGVRKGDKTFPFFSAVHEFEAKIIEQALDEAGGSVTRAAKLLGLTHQTLGTILSQRHKQLAGKRTPRERRLRSIIREPKE